MQQVIMIWYFSTISLFSKFSLRAANLSKHFTGQIQPRQATTKNYLIKKAKKSEWARSPFD